MTLRDSDDQVIHNTRPDIKTGCKWSVSSAISDSESNLKHKDILGATQVDRRRIGHSEMILCQLLQTDKREIWLLLEVQRRQEESCVPETAGQTQQDA